MRAVPLMMSEAITVPAPFRLLRSWPGLLLRLARTRRRLCLAGRLLLLLELARDRLRPLPVVLRHSVVALEALYEGEPVVLHQLAHGELVPHPLLQELEMGFEQPPGLAAARGLLELPEGVLHLARQPGRTARDLRDPVGLEGAVPQWTRQVLHEPLGVGDLI